MGNRKNLPQHGQPNPALGLSAANFTEKILRRLGLINDILDLSKIEAGKMTVYLESFDVRSVLDEVAAMVQPLVRKNGNQLTLEIDPDVGEMRADVTKVRQTLFNLL